MTGAHREAASSGIHHLRLGIDKGQLSISDSFKGRSVITFEKFNRLCLYIILPRNKITAIIFNSPNEFFDSVLASDLVAIRSVFVSAG